MQFSSYKSSTPVENEICSSNLLGDAATSSLRISASYLGNLPSGYDLINHSQPLQSSSISDLLAVAHISTQPIHLIGADSAPQDFKEGTLVPATMLASLLASRGCLHHPSSSFACYNGFPTSTIQMQHPNPIFQSTGFAAEDCWIPDLSPDHRFHPAMFTNELSLSLVRTDSSIHDQCSELNPSAITDHHDSGRCSEQSNIPTSSSSYLKSVHQILEDLSRFVSENVHFRCYAGSSPSNAASVSDECPETAANMSLQKPQIRSKEKQLTTLLKMVDEGYSQCLTEVRNIVSAFHPMTGSDPDATARFLLRSTTFLYDSLKERISARILNTKEKTLSNSQAAEAFESSFIHKKWALQEIRRKEHQLWRPQRGLPERSVSVLRSWMFQNFLHPYPKDSDKQMLAMKSGLTRSQVSNWFINARVRLWKPMIEEMYTEISVRKARWKSHGAENSGRGRTAM